MKKGKYEDFSKAETQESFSECFSETIEEKTSASHINAKKQLSCCKDEFCVEDHKCFCKETQSYKHKHGPYCGHPFIFHNGHVDYIVDGKLHFQHENHCDFHGNLNIINLI